MTFAALAKSKRVAPAATSLTKGKSCGVTGLVGSQSGFIGPAPRLGATISPHAPGLQTKLKVGEPDDRFEQEADRVADQVMRMPADRLSVAVAPPQISRKCAECEEEEKLQRIPAGPEATTGDAPGIVHEVLRSPGQPLDAVTRAYFEPRFGHDFGRVRVHSGARATTSAQKMNAAAYTSGQHVVFGEGRYAPETSEGKQLLAHELTHSMQQRNSRIHRKPRSTKIGKISSDEEQARIKAREIAQLINTGRYKSEGGQAKLAHWLGFFEGHAFSAFTIELQDAIGKKIEEFEGEPKKETEIEASSVEASTIIPTSAATVVRGGFKTAYFAQIFEETSESIGVEVYLDTSASGGLSVELPIKKIFKLKFGVEAKKGRKETEKEEKKTATRTGRTISRSFTIQKLEREVMNYDYIKTYHGAGPIAKKVTHAETGYGPEIQRGFKVVPDEGGEPWGPFWNLYSGNVQVEGTALSRVWDVMRAQQEKIAEDIAFDRR